MNPSPTSPKILFSDFFKTSKQVLDSYGAFNISLVADLPLFIDPFLLFNSANPKYQELHKGLIDYLRFLKDKSTTRTITPGLLKSWYTFKEVQQNWLGFSVDGNKGSALGNDFAKALNENFSQVFKDYGEEQITKGAHLEKLCLVKEGIGKDNISDFTTNLIKEYLLEYTQEFAKKHLTAEQCKTFRIPKVKFNYETETWMEGSYYLPNYKGDFVILTPKNLLTRVDTWINSLDLIEDFHNIPYAISNQELRDQINNYFRSVLPKEPTKKDEAEAARKTILKYPIVIDFYIKSKEDSGDQAENISTEMVKESEFLFLEQFVSLAKLLASKTPFYTTPADSYQECLKRVHYLKSVIEDNDGYKYFYDRDGKPIRREEDLKIAYRFTWYGTKFDFNTEVNNGRGELDVKASMGAADSTIVELKLASNTQLEKNLRNQVEIYKKANRTDSNIKVILYFSQKELDRVRDILKRLGLEDKENVVLVDARNDNKVSASKVSGVVAAVV